VLIRKPDDAKPTLGERLTAAMVKGEVGAEPKPEPTTVEELEEAVKRADDKERLIGLIVAPLAAVIGLTITSSLIANDPKAHFANGAVNHAHVDPRLYAWVGVTTLVLAGLMLAMAWFRKRLYLGILLALYGITIFNLHYWGFGVPFVLIGAWYLVRAYRLHQKLKLAKEDASPGTRSGPARASGRYTPPSSSPGSQRPRRGDVSKAG
jgi:hypothetical protein